MQSLTVGELQHLVDDSGLVLCDAHVLQDLDHHLQHSITLCLSGMRWSRKSTAVFCIVFKPMSWMALMKSGR